MSRPLPFAAQHRVAATDPAPSASLLIVHGACHPPPCHRTPASALLASGGTSEPAHVCCHSLQDTGERDDPQVSELPLLIAFYAADALRYQRLPSR